MDKIASPLEDISCQALLASPDVVHHGILRLKPRMTNVTLVDKVKELFKWAQIYAVVHAGCLYIFDSFSSIKPKRALSLYGITDGSPCSPDEVGPDVSWTFKLVDYRMEVLYFAAPSQSELTKWLAVVNEQITAQRGNRTSLDLSSNHIDGAHSHLKPQSSTMQPWKQLRGGTLPAQFHQPRPVGQIKPTVATAAQFQLPNRKPQPPTPAEPDYVAWNDTGESVPEKQPRPPLAPPPNSSDNIKDEPEKDIYDDIGDVGRGGVAEFMKEQSDKFIGLLKPLKNPFNRTQNQKLSTDVVVESTAPPPVASPPPATPPQSKPTPATPPFKDSRSNSKAVVRPMVPVPGHAQVPQQQQQQQQQQEAYLLPLPEEPSTPEESPEASVPLQEAALPVTPGTGKPRPKPPPKKQAELNKAKPQQSVSAVKQIRGLEEEAYWSKSTPEAEKLMKSLEVDGAYLIRESTNQGTQTLMVRSDKTVQKYFLHRDQAGRSFLLDANQPHFKTVSELLLHYKSNPLPNCDVKLGNAYIYYAD